MTLLTIVQIVSVFIVYIFFSVLLPGWVFGEVFKKKRATVRLVSYYCIGNFVIIMLVQLLTLLHICYVWTIIIALPAVYIAVYRFLLKHPVKEPVKRFLSGVKHLLTGTMGFKNLMANLKSFYLRVFYPRLSQAWRLVVEKKVDFFLIGVIVLCLWYVFGHEMMTQFGYAFSDEPVHNYWTNSMIKQKLYVAGVYPMGYHCILFFLSRLCGLDVYIVIRVFGFTQNVFIFLMVPALIKVLGNTRYIGYLALIMFQMSDFFDEFCSYRYVQALPQEFGQIFILPAVMYIALYIKERSAELAEIKKRKKIKKRRINSTEPILTGCMLSLAVCNGFSAHFYSTLILAIFVVGIIIGYFVYVIRPKFFLQLMKYGLLGIVLAIVPMAISLLMGNKLQGSIFWGLSVMQGDSDTLDAMGYVNEDGISTSADGISVIVGKDYTIINNPSVYVQMLREIGMDPRKSYYYRGADSETETQDAGGITQEDIEEQKRASEVGFFDKLRNRLVWMKNEIDECMRTCLLKRDYDFLIPWIHGGLIVILGAGALFFILRRYWYGCGLITMGVSFFFLLVLLSAASLHLPALMDTFRARIYVAYTLPVVFGLIIDAGVSLIVMITRLRHMSNLAGVMACCLLMVWVCERDYVRQPEIAQQISLSSSAICMTNIIRDNKDFTWTVISASDERNMGYEHGYHYELITFLHDMENYQGTERILIPTEKIFFFVEKKPVMIEQGIYEGYSISPELAFSKLGPTSGNGSYIRDGRFHTMSRFNEWMQVFAERYRHEVDIYYETDDFVCYVLNQNTYNLFNLAADYFFNTLDYENEGESRNRYINYMLDRISAEAKEKGITVGS